MPNWYVGRTAVKRAGGLWGADFNRRIDDLIEAFSRQLDDETRRFFIPRTQTRVFRWPPEQSGRSWVLWLDADLISVTTLQTKAQDASPTTVPSTAYFLELANFGPPYNRIEIDQSSTAAFESGDTPQRSISVEGSWGYSADTKGGGTVGSGLDGSASATEFVASDGSKIDVGDTLLIESEQVFVSEVSNAASGAALNGALTADQSEVSVTVDDASGLNAGEVILVDSERMYIESISGNVLTVRRAYDGSTLAAHNTATAVHVFRTYTIERGVNGTTAATHADGTAISVYAPPANIVTLVRAEVLAAFQQERSAWGREVGQGKAGREFTGRSLAQFHERVVRHYKRLRTGVI